MTPHHTTPHHNNNTTTHNANTNGIMSPSLQWQKTVAFAPKAGATLSLIGSTYIVYDCWRKLRGEGGGGAGHHRTPSPHQQQHPQPANNSTTTNGRHRHPRRSFRRSQRQRRCFTYHRLMMGVSVGDIMYSIAFWAGTLPMPADTPNTYGAIGSTETCTLFGVLAHGGVTGILYNASLATYYLLRIKHNWSPSQIEQGAEKWFHCIPIGFGIISQIILLWKQQYNSNGFICYVTAIPRGCQETWEYGAEQATCVRGDNSWLYLWSLLLGPKVATIIAVTILMFLVYRSVLLQERRAMKYRFQEQEQSQSRWMIEPTPTLTPTQLCNNNNNNNNNDSTNRGGNSSHKKGTTPQQQQQQQDPLLVVEPQQQVLGVESSSSSPQPQLPMQSSCQNDDEQSPPQEATTAPTSSSTPPPPSPPSPPPPRRSPKLQLSRELGMQSYCYLGALYLTYLPPLLSRLYEMITNRKRYGVIVVLGIILPLQGFWNLLIYLRPQYLQQRRRIQQQQPQQQQRTARRSPLLAQLQSSPLLNSRVSAVLEAMSYAVREGDLNLEDEDNDEYDEKEEEEVEAEAEEEIETLQEQDDILRQENEAEYDNSESSSLPAAAATATTPTSSSTQEDSIIQHAMVLASSLYRFPTDEVEFESEISLGGPS